MTDFTAYRMYEAFTRGIPPAILAQASCTDDFISQEGNLCTLAANHVGDHECSNPDDRSEVKETWARGAGIRAEDVPE